MKNGTLYIDRFSAVSSLEVNVKQREKKPVRESEPVPESVMVSGVWADIDANEWTGNHIYIGVLKTLTHAAIKRAAGERP